MTYKLTLTGLEDLLARMQADPRAIDNALTQGMRLAGFLVEGRAKELAPVRTGTLRRSITSDVQQLGNRVVAVVGTNVRYAPYVELGTRRKVARPYLKPALAQKAAQALAIIKQKVEAALGS